MNILTFGLKSCLVVGLVTAVVGINIAGIIASGGCE